MSAAAVPYTPALAMRLLRDMTAARLAAIAPQDFQRWPAPLPLPAAIGRELIEAERARRVGAGL